MNYISRICAKFAIFAKFAILAKIANFAKMATLQGATFGIQFESNLNRQPSGDFSTFLPFSPLHAFLDIGVPMVLPWLNKGFYLPWGRASQYKTSLSTPRALLKGQILYKYR